MSQFLTSSVTFTENDTLVTLANDESQTMDLGGGEGVQYSEILDAIEVPKRTVPGSSRFVDEIDEEDIPEPEPERVELTWAKDRAVDSFMQYISESYPAKIPRHDGKNILGAERAIRWLTDLAKEISEAVRRDETGILDDSILEATRVSIMKDILLLKEHIKKLDKNFKGKLKKKAGLDEDLMKYAEEIELAYNHGVNDEIKKIAFTPKINLFVSPFERALSGIIINSVVSGGKPLDEVYDFLKEKYKLTDREELAIMQVVMDSGFPIFKDRGTFSEKKTKDPNKTHGIEFIKNYFA